MHGRVGDEALAGNGFKGANPCILQLHSPTPSLVGSAGGRRDKCGLYSS